MGVRTAEQGLYKTMGLEIQPKSFDFDFKKGRVYTFTILSNNLELQKYYKVGSIIASKGNISITVNGKSFSINPIIQTGVMFKEGTNLDKKTTNMYN